MNIWLINHYAVPPRYFPLARQTYFAKNLMEMGHQVTIFAASTVHNSDMNLIENAEPYRCETVEGVSYVYIRCMNYQGNGLRRIYNMCEFAWKLPGVCKHFPSPDAIVATSMPPTSCAMGVHLARKYGCRGIAEIADLWPESIVVYGYAGPRNPAVVALRMLEKWIYKKADAVVFTMEGGYDYIREQGWEKEIPASKVYHINNGVDLRLYRENCQKYQIQDEDLDDPDTFKVIYAGSVRKANGLDELVECASRLRDYPKIRFLVYGNGDYVEPLRQRCREENLDNIIFKGGVAKNYVPYILSKSDLNVQNYSAETAKVCRFGSSQNKMFEYFASGKPVLANVAIAYSPIERYECGISENLPTGEKYAEAVLRMYNLPREAYDRMCANAQKAASDYDFQVLTQKLLAAIEGIQK